MPKMIDPEKCSVFFDFDNTITTYDVLDDMILKFSMDERWKDLEEKWKKGRIGSRECLKGQVEGVRIGKASLDRYLLGAAIDPYFKKLLGLLDSKKIPVYILSDNFDYILDRILKNNGLGRLKLYSNSLDFDGERLVPKFPLTNRKCGSCAHCKKTTLVSKRKPGGIAVYIGDGRSDICASQCAELVFAKNGLLGHYKANGLRHEPYKDLKDVYDHMKRSLS